MPDGSPSVFMMLNNPKNSISDLSLAHSLESQHTAGVRSSSTISTNRVSPLRRSPDPHAKLSLSACGMRSLAVRTPEIPFLPLTFLRHVTVDQLTLLAFGRRHVTVEEGCSVANIFP